MQLEVTGDDVVVGIRQNKGRKKCCAPERLRAGAARMLPVGVRGA